MLALPPSLCALRAIAPGQSAFSPEAEVSGVCDPPVELGEAGAPPEAALPAVPLAPELCADVC
ncbi:hypothetical protein TSA66_01705 [Noviherbaspirillum autotrophicum]|uniref:Uncharacterized protein n=1 Tax=Noviherbaspirillum autotrophicum TaxID=709839 RepID=A0A0C2BIL1_9BURK|nr:hypothetical protein TSA66_01705 [Noviherbaspirillum autotrophicum]